MSYTFFVICRTVQVCSDAKETLVDKFHMMFTSALYIALANNYVAVMCTKDAFVPFLRRYIRFLNDGEENQENKQQKYAVCFKIMTEL